MTSPQPDAFIFLIFQGQQALDAWELEPSAENAKAVAEALRAFLAAVVG